MQQAKQISDIIFGQQRAMEIPLFWQELVQVGFLSSASEVAFHSCVAHVGGPVLFSS